MFSKKKKAFASSIARRSDDARLSGEQTAAAGMDEGANCGKNSNFGEKQGKDRFQVRSQELASLGLPGQDPAMAVISAERIMYKHAIDLCQAAALDELFGNPQLCSQRLVQSLKKS